MRYILYFLLFYVLFRLIRAAFRMMVSGSSQQNFDRRPKNSNVGVNKKPDKSSSGYNGGEYIDYEEVD